MDAKMPTNLDLVGVSMGMNSDASELLLDNKLALTHIFQKIKLFEEEKREWSQLPIELVEAIAEHVVSISDFIRFRSVCKSWRKAAAPCKLRPQPPIMVHRYNVFKPDRYLFSITTGRTHCISLPQLVGKKILDSTNGWMLLHDVQTLDLSLHNPVSFSNIHLPPTNKFVKIIKYGCIYADHFTGNFVVTFSDYEGDEVWFCKVGDESWSSLRYLIIDDFLKDGIGILYYYTIYDQGKFFAMCSGSIYIIDSSVASTGQWLCAGSIKDIPEYNKDENGRYADEFFVTFNGELFLAFDFGGDTDGISFYKLYFGSPQLKWSKVQLEDYAIFTCVEQPFMCCVKDFPQYKKNCSYVCQRGWSPTSQTELWITDCQDGKSNIIQCEWERPADFKEKHLWITPSFR